ncbi:MAG: extracellular solute-binding protein [Acidimicrobiales bacterium]
MLAIGLAACSSTSSTSAAKHKTPAASANKVTLTFWNAYNLQDAEASTMAKVIIPAFEKLHPNITVHSVVYPYASLLPKLLASVSAGNPPNLVRSDIIWVPQLANMGALLPLSKDMPGFAGLASKVFPGPLSTNKWHGTYYGLPLDTNTQSLVWNKADFAAAHLSGPPTTMSQLLADAKLLTNPAKHQFGLGVDGTDMWNVAPFVWSMGGSFTNSSATKASGYMNSPTTVKALQTLYTMYKQGIVGTDFLGGPGTVSGEEGMPKGQYAMYIDGPWAVGTFAGLKPPFTGYGITPMPAGAGGSVSVVGGEDIVIPAGAKNPTASEEFLKFLMTPFSQLKMAEAGQMGTLKSIAPQEAKISGQDYAPFAVQLKTALPRPVTPAYTKIDTQFGNLLQEVLHGKLSMKAALNQEATYADSQLSQG